MGDLWHEAPLRWTTWSRPWRTWNAGRRRWPLSSQIMWPSIISYINYHYKIFPGHPGPTLPGDKFNMFLWEVSWASSSLDFENTWHCHIQPASWSNKRITVVVLLINAQPCSYWVNIATGANYPAMELIGPILPEVDIFPKKYLKISEKCRCYEYCPFPCTRVLHILHSCLFR